MRHLLIAAVGALALAACNPVAQQETPPPAQVAVSPDAANIVAAVADSRRPDADKERDAARHPAETLAFAGIE
ncbi:MAG: methyltransferase, partial [Terricaulis sp.]